MPEITFRLDAQDFQQLSVAKYSWRDGQWDDPGRFEPVGRTPVSFEWGYAYVIGECWASVVLIRGYLDAMIADYQIVWDTAESEWLILTDYKEGK